MIEVFNRFPERLREVRLENKLSQKALGKLLGYTQVCVAKWESGQREPNYDDLMRICKILKCSSDFILGLED